MSDRDEYRYRWQLAPQLGDCTVGQLEELGGGFESRMHVEGGRLPYPVSVVLVRDRDDRVGIGSLHIDLLEQEVITTTSLRAVGAALRDIAEAVELNPPEAPPKGAARTEESWERWKADYPDGLVHLLVTRRSSSGLPKRGRRPLPDEYYREVARLFADAQAEDSRRPYTLLARRLYKSESQTRRLVREAWKRFPELRPMEGKS